jgi:hypothetical protein
VQVGSASARSDLSPRSGGWPVAELDGISLGVAAQPINDVSHNEMADIGLRHLGYLVGAGSTYDAGGVEVVDWLDTLGVDTTGIVFHDGSGLSHDNRVTPRSVVALFDYFETHPEGEAWRRSLSIAGVTGTLAGRMAGEATNGRFWGKTGTLNGVICTSGILYHPRDGHRYYVSMLMNDVGSATQARSMHDDVVETLAQDWRGEGTRPGAPVLQVVSADSQGLRVSWSASSGAEGYVLHVAPAGTGLGTRDGIWVEDTEFLLTGLPAGKRYDVQVVAVNAQGLSDPSDVYTGSAGPSGADVLVVDGNDRLATQYENPHGHGHTFAQQTGDAVVGHTIAMVANEAVVSGAVSLGSFDAVVWVLGEESSVDESLSRDEQARVEDYLTGGGNLFISGAELGWDLWALGDSEDQGFYTEVLGAAYVADDAETYRARATSGGLFDGLPDLYFYRPGWLEASYPDQLSTSAGGRAELTYIGGQGGIAATSYRGAGRVVVLGFPFETIDGRTTRAEVMRRVLEDFGL